MCGHHQFPARHTVPLRFYLEKIKAVRQIFPVENQLIACGIFPSGQAPHAVIYVQGKDLGHHGKNYLNLIRFVRRLQANPISAKGERLALFSEIEKTSDVAERAWLLSVVGK